MAQSRVRRRRIRKQSAWAPPGQHSAACPYGWPSGAPTPAAWSQSLPGPGRERALGIASFARGIVRLDRQRKDVLFAFFVVAALLLDTRYAESPSLKRFLLWMGCALLALMSKPTAMVLPVILILLDWWPLHRIRIPRQLPQSVGGAPAAGTVAAPSGRASIWILGRWIPLLDKIPVAAASLAVLLYSVSEHRLAGATGMLSGLSFATRLSNAVVGYVRYLGMIVWPASLGCLYPYASPSL